MNHGSAIALEYSTTGNSGPWISIANHLPDNGRYQWIVPAVSSSGNCYIRIIASDSITSTADTVINMNPFTIGCQSAVATNEFNNDAYVSVFPNPSAQKIYIYIKNSNANVNCKLYDCTGRLIERIDPVIGDEIIINKENTGKGMFFLEISGINSIPIVKKLVFY
jgi:hypothetical protein